MLIRNLFFSAVFVSAFILAGCTGSTPPANTNASNTAATTNAAPANTGAISTPAAKTPEQTANNAPTVTPVVKAYCDAMTKKDEAALRKVFSQATLKYYEQEMKADNAKTMVEYMSAEQVSNKLCEARNEKIEGETAIAEVRTEGAPNGFKIKFVRENGEWKMTNESPEINAVKESVSNSSTAK